MISLCIQWRPRNLIYRTIYIFFNISGSGNTYLLYYFQNPYHFSPLSRDFSNSFRFYTTHNTQDSQAIENKLYKKLEKVIKKFVYGLLAASNYVNSEH